MKFKIFIISVFLIPIQMVFSQNLKGIYFLDEISKTPVSSVLVVNVNENFQRNSDENGWVSLQGFNFEDQKVYVSGIGYEKEEFDLSLIKKEKDFGYKIGRASCRERV